MASVHDVSLKQIVALCDTFGLLVDGIVDPNSLVMVVGTTKNVIFTKLASKVLSAVKQRHPLEKVIHNAALLYTLETGDDSSVFLLLLKGVMDGIKDMLQESNEIEVRRTMLKQVSCLKSLVPDIFKNMLNTYAQFSYVNFCFTSDKLENLVSTFFYAKFSVNVAEKLSHLMCTFLSSSILDSGRPIEVLTYFISNFNAFCSKVISPFSESAVLEGFLLHDRLLPLWESNKTVYFVVILDIPHKSDNVVWNTNEENFMQKLVHRWDSVNNILKHLKNLEISLILTINGVSDDFNSLCSQNGILVLSRIAKEDIDNILHVVNICPMSCLRDSVGPQNVACLESLSLLTKGNTSFIHLKVSLSNYKFLIPHYILLCASFEEVLKDYYSECLNCLKVVKQWLNPTYKKFFDEQKTSNHLKMVKSLENSSNSLSNSFKHMSFKSNNSAYTLGVAFPLGLFEFALKNMLSDFCNDKSLSFQKLCGILESALLTVTCKVWNISRPIVDERNYLEFEKKIKCRITAPIEPASTKEILLYKILQLIEQLIKIDAVLSAK